MQCGAVTSARGLGGVLKVRCACGWVTATIDGDVSDWAALEARMTAAHGEGWPMAKKVAKDEAKPERTPLTVSDSGEVRPEGALQALVDAAEAERGPYVLVEAPDGSGAYRVDVPAEVGKERVLSLGGAYYEHCADAPDGRWIYRVSR